MRPIPRRCAKPGCNNLTEKSWCPAHLKQKEQQRGSGWQRYPAGWREMVAEAIRRQPWCSRCGSTQDLTGDHPTPISRGGAMMQRPVVLCRSCNSSKSNRPGG